MKKSRNRRSGPIPVRGLLPNPGAPQPVARPADLLLRARPAADLDSILARGPDVQGAATSAPKSPPASSARANEAERLAREGARLASEGRFAAAIPLFQRSIKLNPEAATSHHQLGVAMLSAGRLEQAADAFTATLRLNLRIAAAHYGLAYIFDCKGQEDKAIAGYRAAIRLKPDLAAAQFRLGELYHSRRQRVEAVAAFRSAAAPAGTFRAAIAEARALEASDAFDEALAAARAAVDAFPDIAEAHTLLAKLLGQAGHSAEAVAHYARATELSPDAYLAWFGLATNRTFTSDDGPLIARMNEALARANLTVRDRQHLHFALGKVHDDMGNYEAAMRNFEAGNRIRALSGSLDREGVVRSFDRMIAPRPGHLDRQPDRGVEDATPILIVGMPRSGSTLVEQILSSHPEIAAGGELEFWAARTRSDPWSLIATPEATRQVANDYLSTLQAFGPAKRVTDKALGNFAQLGLIHRVFPNATLIHCRRHPVDNALSMFTTNIEATIAYMSNRADLVFSFRQYQRLMAHWREILPPDRLIEVDYEALVADPEPHARRLIAACGLEWSDACLQPQRNARIVKTASVWQARQPIYRTSVERWRRYEPWLGELRELLSEPDAAPS
jgi:tetratricopeptide (TPR) repeat protein